MKEDSVSIIPNRSVFISKRKHIFSKERIENILWYVIECYLLILNNQAKYSKTWVTNNTSIKFENYLRNRLVEDYLIQNKKLLEQKMPTLNEINFSYETEKEYTDLQDNKIKSDKIDIYINKLKLKKIWKENDENVYFAIECKRIEQMNDTNINLYIDDIVKCTNREHRKLRLPFEGQLAFIENQDITHIALSNRINEKLKSKTAIVTDAFLDYLLVNQNYQGTYLSKHKRNNQKLFSIYHLFLDYSEIVVK